MKEPLIYRDLKIIKKIQNNVIAIYKKYISRVIYTLQDTSTSITVIALNRYLFHIFNFIGVFRLAN